MWRRGSTTWMGLLALPLFVGCTSATGPVPDPICVGPGATELGSHSCLVVSQEVEAHVRGAEVAAWIMSGFPAVRSALDLDSVEIRVGGAGPRIIPQIGSGGFATGRTVELQIDLDSDFDPEFQEQWVRQLLAHELHHVERLRTVGRPGSVGALVVFEGMADRFAEDFGGRRVAPWSSALDGAERDLWVHRVLAEHPRRDFDEAAWLFGTTAEIPRWTGYTVGHVIAGEYLRLTGRSAAAAATDAADLIVRTVRDAR